MQLTDAKTAIQILLQQREQLKDSGMYKIG